MITENTATVLPFRDAALRAPIDLAAARLALRHEPAGESLPDNVIVLARFARSARRTRRFVLAPPPDGEAA